MAEIAFNKTGYDPFIDFIKAYSILVVVFCHGFPYLKETGYAIWGVQIPLFFLIQVFHCYKREPKQINWHEIAKRIAIPFFMIEFFILTIYLINGHESNYKALITSGLIGGGGYGPGSYYPWVYLQMAILIPIVRPVCDRLEKLRSLMVFILFQVAIEIFCSLINLPDFLFRLLCLRYLFLMWLGWIWVKDGIKINALTVVASFISLAAIIYFAYYERDLEPWFYSTGWATHRWICYFWVSWLFVGILHKAYLMFSKFKVVNKIVKRLASASYEIFLVQIAYYALVSINKFTFIGDGFFQFTIWFVLAFIVSVGGGIALQNVEKKYLF